MRARRVAVKLDPCVGCGLYHLRVELVEYLGREEFRNVARTMRALFMDLASRQPWTWQRRFKTPAEAEAFAVELCQALKEPCFLKDGRVYVVPPVVSSLTDTESIAGDVDDGSVAA